MSLGLVPLVCPRIQNGIRDDDLSIAGRPFAVTVGIRDNLPKSIAIQGREFLVKAFHLIFPLAVCDERLRADNHDVFQIGAGLQLLDNQTGLDGFTDTDAVCNQNPWFVCFYQLQCRSECARLIKKQREVFGSGYRKKPQNMTRTAALRFRNTQKRSRANKNRIQPTGTPRTRNVSPGRFLFENLSFSQVKSRRK